LKPTVIYQTLSNFTLVIFVFLIKVPSAQQELKY